MWNVVPGAYNCAAASRDRWVPTIGTGRPGYVTIPSVIRWLRSISWVLARVVPMCGDGSAGSGGVGSA